MDPTAALTNKISLAQSDVVEERERFFGRDSLLKKSEIRELLSIFPASAFTGEELVAFADETLLYTLRFDGESGAVIFFAMHFLGAIPRSNGCL